MSRRISCCALFLTFALAAPAFGLSADETLPAWTSDVNAAWQKTLDTHRPMLVVVGSEGCSHCRRMQAETWSDSNVLGELSAGFVTARVDGNRQPSLLSHWNVRAYPTTLIFADDGRVLAKLTGYRSAGEIRGHLRAALEATQTIQPVQAQTEQIRSGE